jgi:hypothetical protein
MSQHKFKTRRAALGALASLTALAIPAAAMVAPADPIFAAIEKHRLALAAFAAASNLTDDVKAEQEGREVTEADWTADDAALKAEGVALEELATTVPLTSAGARAMLEYCASSDAVDFTEYSAKIMRTLRRSPVFA